MVKPIALLTAAMLIGCAGSAIGAEETQGSVAAAAGTVVLQAHAVGAQIYECKANADGRLVWQFREPIATLMLDGKTIGRHYLGPAWDMADGSRIVGKVIVKSAGTSSSDIPWLRLSVSDRRGEGILTPVTTVQRINTVGGNKVGACAEAGTFASEPYAADYVFSRP